MKTKKIVLIVVLIILVIIGFKYSDYNLIFATEKEKDSIKESIEISKNAQSFKAISYTESILGFNGDKAKILIFNISKNDYISNNLNYSDENIDGLTYGTNKIDMGEYYKCKIKLDNVDTKSDYDNLKPFSIINLLLESLYIICIVIILVNIFMNIKKAKMVVIAAMSIIVLLFTCLFYCNHTRFLMNKSIKDSSSNNSFLKEKQLQESNNIEKNKSESIVSSQKQDLSATDSSNKVMLTNIMGEDNINKFYNENETNNKIKELNILKGVYVDANDRDFFLKILKICTNIDYSYDENGYLKYQDIESDDTIAKNINEYIKADKTMIIKISDKYASIIRDMVYEFMIEETAYVQVFEYNSNVKVALINPKKLNSSEEDISQKEVYEEILLNIFNK